MNNLFVKVPFDEVMIHLNVLSAIMLNRIVGDNNGCLVITDQVCYRARSNVDLS